MSDIITTLHPENDENTNLYPNIKKDNIPDGVVDENKLSESVNDKLNNLLIQLSNAIASIDQPKYYTSLPTTDVGLVVYTDGYLYYWNGTQYVTTGIVYQATQIGSDIDVNNFNIITKYVLKTEMCIKNTLNKLSIWYENGSWHYTVGSDKSYGFSFQLTNAQRIILKDYTNYKYSIYLASTNNVSDISISYGGINVEEYGVGLDNLNNYCFITFNKADNTSFTSSDLEDLVKNFVIIDEVKLTEYINNLNLNIEYLNGKKCIIDTQTGYYTDTGNVLNRVRTQTRCRTSKAINTSLNNVIHIHNSGSYQFLVNKVDSVGVTTGGNWISAADTYLEAGYYYYLIFRKSDNSNITDDDMVNIPNQITAEYIFNSDDLDVIPEYWQTTLDTIINNLEGKLTDTYDKISFFYISDVHYPQNYGNSAKLIKYLNDKLSLDLLINCGDNIYENSYTKIQSLNNMNKVNKDFMASVKHYFYATGNHDDNNNYNTHNSEYATNAITNADFYNYIFSKFDNVTYGVTGKYYYYDDKVLKNRIIVLDSYNPEDWGANADRNYRKYGNYGTTQLTWLVGVLNNLPSDYTSIVVTHNTQTDTEHQDWYVCQTILDAFKNRTSGTVDSISYDFTESEGELMFILSGHTHADSITTTTGGIKIVKILTDSYQNGDKVQGTTNEQAFDIVEVNRNTKEVNLYRVGEGSNRNFTY